MTGQATLAVVSGLKELTTKARRQPVKVVKLAGSLACVVGPKKNTENNKKRVIKTLACQQHVLCAGAKPAYTNLYQQSVAVR